MGEPILARYDGLLLDMDGVIYLDRRPLPDALDFVREAQARGKKILFLTNNSRYTVAEYVERLSSMGLECRQECIFTSAVATADFISENLAGRARKAFVIGGPGLREEMERVGLSLVEGEEAKGAELVVVGWDVELTYEKLKIACLAISRGAEFVGSNPDASFPAPEGIWPGAGAIIACLEKATGRQATVVGKPNIFMMQLALARLGTAPDRTLMIGDRLETDVLGGWRAGMDTCLVLTGVTRREDIEGFEPRPDYVVESLLELL
jgi:4-nitrophenyl phosphatase